MPAIQTSSPCVYYVECTSSGKRYVGSTTFLFSSRASNHRHLLRKGKHYNRAMQEDWNTYGEDKFVFVMVGEVPFEDLLSEEARLCKEWDTFNPERGYNKLTVPSSHGLDLSRKFRGRPKGEAKVVFYARVTEDMYDRLCRCQEGVEQPEVAVLKEDNQRLSLRVTELESLVEARPAKIDPPITLEPDSVEVKNLRMEVARLKAKIKEYEQMYG